MGRYKSVTMKFGQPLSTPQSKRVFACYATHGKGYGPGPPVEGADILILLVNAARDVLWAEARFDGRDYRCDVARIDQQWKRLGWTMADGWLPLGELDNVDPDLAQFQYLASADTTNRSLGAASEPHAPGCTCEKIERHQHWVKGS